MGYSRAEKNRIWKNFIIGDYARGKDYVYDGLKKIASQRGAGGKRRRRQKRRFKKTRQKGGFIDDIANFFESL